MKNFTKLSDEELVSLVRENNQEAIGVLIERYKYMVRAFSRSFYLSGGDNEDLIQEGMIGLVKAINSYNGKASFKSYAYICVKSSILTAVKNYSCLKHSPLNNYISLSGTDGSDADKNEIMIASCTDPETLFIDGEAASEFKKKLKDILSSYEYRILTIYLQGYSYEEIAFKLKKNVKSIDNALQRIRRKIINSALL